MNYKAFFLTALICYLSSALSLADSPLTSTNFSKAYIDEPIVITASKTNGKLTNVLIEYLALETNPVDIKMAIINELGWDFKGKRNAERFIKYLKKEKGYSSEVVFLKNGTSCELLIVGYLRAMDNYFEVDDALRFSGHALEKNPHSYTYAIIHALIKAQKELGNDWCQVFTITDAVRDDSTLVMDLRKEANDIIFDYIEPYGAYCEGIDLLNILSTI